MLYHLSKDPNLSVLTPRISKKIIEGIEDNTTPRVSFSTSINGCLNALGVFRSEIYSGSLKEFYETEKYIKDNTRYYNKIFWSNKILEASSIFSQSLSDMESINIGDKYISGRERFPVYYVYVPKHPPTKCELAHSVYDFDITHEVWVTEEIEVENIGTIIVDGIYTQEIVTCKVANGKKIKTPFNIYHYSAFQRGFISSVTIYDEERKSENNDNDKK